MAQATGLFASRVPNDSRQHLLTARISIRRLADGAASGAIAASVYSGHEYARELDAAAPVDVRFRRERVFAP